MQNLEIRIVSFSRILNLICQKLKITNSQYLLGVQIKN